MINYKLLMTNGLVSMNFEIFLILDSWFLIQK